MAQKHPFPLNVIRIAFPVLQTLLPTVANKLAIKLFLTPVRFGFTEKEKEDLPKFKQYTLKQNDKSIAMYSIGEGPVIVCVHGWSGRAMQFRLLASELAKEGYKVVAFDAWGHGQSAGKMSSLFEFAQGLEIVMQNETNVKAVFAHSLGSAASSYYAERIGKLPALVTFGAPVIAEDILSSFSETINASKKIHKAMRKEAVLRYDVTFDEVAMEHTFKSVICPVLALHGYKDKDVPHTHLDALKAINPSIDARKYEGIGHRGILKNDRVISDVVEWVKQL